MFNDCQSLISLDLSSFDTTNAMFMSSMFFNCAKLTNLQISNFKTTNVKSLVSMFYSCSSLTSLSLPYFDTSKLKNNDMGTMFEGCKNLTLSIDKDKCSNLVSILPDYVKVL